MFRNHLLRVCQPVLVCAVRGKAYNMRRPTKWYSLKKKRPPWKATDKVRPPQLEPHQKSASIAEEDELSWSNSEKTHPLPDSLLKEYPYDLPDGGKQYLGFKYYPRFPGEEDPPVEPAPLHMVRRTRGLAGTPWWEKEVMHQLKLDRRNGDVVILKNTPEMNSMLYKVKHLVEIKPIHPPEDMPLDADPAHCFLTEEGEFIYNPAIAVSDLEPDAKLERVKWTGDMIVAEARHRWINAWQLKLD